MSFSAAPAPDLSIVIPCFNEAPGIRQTATRVVEHMRDNHSNTSFELILVNDGSSDSTGEVLTTLTKEDSRIRALHFSFNRGRGAAIKTGIKFSRGRLLILLDADLSYDVDHITQILSKFLADPKVDVVVVSPYMRGGVVRGVPLFRLLLSRVANWILASAFAEGLSTATCVVRGYKGEFIRKLPLFEEGKELHLEILRKASVCNANIVEVPGRLIWKTGKQARRKTNMRIVKAASRHFLYGMLVRPTQFFKYFAVLLLAVGLYELIVLANVFSSFYEASGNFSGDVWVALAKTFQQSPHTVVIASVALIMGLQAFSFLALFQLLKLQQEESIRHLLAILERRETNEVVES